MRRMVIVVVFSRDICLQVIMWGLRVNYRIGASIFIAGVDGEDHDDVDDGDWWSVWPDRV